jgi:hypothetical protein
MLKLPEVFALIVNDCGMSVTKSWWFSEKAMVRAWFIGSLEGFENLACFS